MFPRLIKQVSHLHQDGIMNTTAIPEGFTPFTRSSPLLDLLGPIYARGQGLHLELGY